MGQKSRQIERALENPGNPWNWYEVCKAMRPGSIGALASAFGELPDAAREGYAEWATVRGLL